MVKNIKIWFPLMALILLFMAIIPLNIMAEDVNVNNLSSVAADELPIEPVGDIEVKTVETKTEDGLLVEETSVPKSQLIYALPVKDDSIIQANALDESTESEIMAKMESALIDLDPELNLSEYQIPDDEMVNNGLTVVSELFYRVLNNNFDLFYMAPKITTYYDSDKMVSKVVFTYVCDGSEVTGQLSEEETLEVMYTNEEYKKGKSDLIYSANISDAMSDVEKVLAIHDALCKWANYDYSYTNYYADGIFINHSGVCQAYTYAFHSLLSDVGIAGDDLDIVISDSMNHAWNMVRIDGEWYHIDVTWDDDSSFIERTYFLKSDEKLKNHSGWSKYLPVADSDRFDNYFASDDYMYYSAGKWYYYDSYSYYTEDGKRKSEYRFVCSNIDGSDVETVLNTEVSEFTVLNGKIYYVPYRFWNEDLIKERQIYSCNLDGTDNELFDTIGDDDGTFITSLGAEVGVLTCDVFCHSYEQKYADYSFIKKYDVQERLVSSLTVDKNSSYVGSPVNLSATASGGDGQYQYKFYYKDSSGESHTIQDFSSSSEAVFYPESVVECALCVDVSDSDVQNCTSLLKNYLIAEDKTGLNLFYKTQVQNVGWQNGVTSGEMSGTEGQSLRLEGLKVELTEKEGVGIKYTTHVQNIGWQNYVADGELSGTVGQGLRLEAVKMELTGENADKYDIYYRVHAQNVGWMGWAKNGECSGTAGYGYRLEGIEIKIVEKGEQAPGSTDNAFVKK